ncbi:MAG: hypothetical protein P1P93_02010 [Gammaproteobacteria bacterium]|nr:hypothetical protein [Gammaproteobacteria bacterium]
MNIIKYTLFVVATLFTSVVFAEPTHVMVRAKAVDAKFIGTSVGGVKVVVEDAETGEILDTGWINGGTGSTSTLISQPITRGQTLTDKDTAGFVATLDISSPRLVRFTLIGPYGFRQSLQQASLTSWVIPGKDILGDGIIISMSGFIVDAWTRVLEGGKVDIYTQTSLLCGCPIYPDGPWDPVNYQAKAIIMHNQNKVDEVDLAYTGPTGLFSGNTTITESGHYKAIVYLIDTKTGNVGVDRAMFEVDLN